MAAISSFTSSFLRHEPISANSSFLRNKTTCGGIRKKGVSLGRRGSLRVQAVKVPAGVQSFLPYIAIFCFTNIQNLFSSEKKKTCLLRITFLFLF
jgi:hypothetical protein